MSTDEPKTLDTEDSQADSDESIEQMMEDTQGLHATRDEAVAEGRADDEVEELEQEDGDRELDSDDKDQDEPKVTPKKVRATRSRKPTRGAKKDALIDFLREGYVKAMESDRANLKAQLAGNLLLRFRDSGRCISFEGPSGEVQALSSSQASGYQSDCTVDLSENHLEQILDGDLNPQVAMLSEKLRVQGKLSLAVYFFNVFDSNY